MTQNILSPNLAVITEHLQKLFSNYDQYKDGLIEIAYTPSNTGAVNQASLFELSQINEAAAFAVKVNAQEGVNVYVGASLRNPDAIRHKRTSVVDFYAANCVWLDLDDEGSTVGLKDKYKDLPPYHVVVTGRKPHMRAQLWWKLDEAVTDPNMLYSTLGSLCRHFSGDPAVVDPIRVMRLGGTIAWPKKEGRVAEMTSSSAPANNTPICSIEKLHSYFPGAASPLLTQAATGGVDHDGKPRHVLTGKLKITELLEATRQPGHWHHNMRDAVASMVSSGWTDEQIKLACAPYCNQGAGDPDLLPLIGTGRRKWEIPEPELNIAPERYNPVTGEVKPLEASPIKATSIDDIDLDNIPPREFLYADILARKYVSMVIAPPGAGKSILSMQLGLSAASGKAWGEWSSKVKGLNVWVYNNEEGSDELTRRVKGIMMHNHISKKDIAGHFYIDSGERQSINVAKLQGETVTFTGDYLGMLQEIVDRKIDILIVDPFAEIHSVAENSNDGMKVVTALFRKIAFDANCAVLLIHHAKKWAEGMAGNADSGRGGGAQIGVVRRAFTLAKMSEDEAKKMGVPNERRHWYVRFDDAKSNITAPAEKTLWLKFKSINIMNGAGLYPDGDSVGVLDHISVDDIKKETGDVLNSDQEKALSYVAMYSEGAGGKSFPFTDARDYILEKDPSLGGRQRVTKLIKDGVEYSGSVNYMGTLYVIDITKNTSEKGKEYIFVSEEK